MNKLFLAVPFTMALMVSGASAQQQEGLVTVNVSDTEILNELNLADPITVEAPVGIAAQVCGIDAKDLAKQKQDDDAVTCEAQNSSQAFANLVSKQQQN
jgi:hypothetical protein